MRRVVILCGPAGSGKTTAARASGLEVFDRDDPQWTTEKQFTIRLALLARDPEAQAVVIRSGATSTARARAAGLINATHVYLMPLLPIAELTARIAHRNRADKVHGIASVKKWYATFDDQDAVARFTGWTAIAEAELSLGRSSRAW